MPQWRSQAKKWGEEEGVMQIISLAVNKEKLLYDNLIPHPL